MFLTPKSSIDRRAGFFGLEYLDQAQYRVIFVQKKINFLGILGAGYFA